MISLHSCSSMMTSATKLFYLFFPFFCTNHTTSAGKYICIRCFKFVYDDFDAILDFVDLEILSL